MPASALPASTYARDEPFTLLLPRRADMTPLQVLHGTVDAPREMQPLYGLLNAELLQVERGKWASPCPARRGAAGAAAAAASLAWR